MKKITKLLLASTVTFGTLMGASVSATPVATHAHAATTPYYSYQGYIGKDASFLTNKHFINAVKHNNVTFNHIKLDSTKESGSTNKVDKYDQTFKYVSKDKKHAGQMQFIIKGDLSLTDVSKAYGKSLKKETDQTNDKQSGIFYYKPSKNGLGVWFVADHNRIVEVSVGHVPYTTSK